MVKRFLAIGMIVAACGHGTAARADDCADALSARQFPEAVAACTRDIEANAFRGVDLIARYLNRSLAYRGLNRVDEAIRDNEYAIDLFHRAGDPPQVGMSLHYHLAWTLHKDRQYAKSIETLTDGLRYQPDFSFAYYARALGHDAIGDKDKARADLGRFVEILTGSLRDRDLAVSDVIRDDAWFFDIAFLRRYGIVE